MSFAPKTYATFAFLVAASIVAAAPVAAQTPTLRSPKKVEGFYTTLYGNPLGNGTGNFTFIVWDDSLSRQGPNWGGFRVRRTIQGVSATPLEVVGQWKARWTQASLCWLSTSPCTGEFFNFTGTGLFFRGFRENKRPDGTFVINYPPGAPQDTCSNCWVFADGSSLSGFRTEYAVTAIDTTNVADLTSNDFIESPVDSSEIVRILPGSPPQTNLETVAVVPNPYKGSANWDASPWDRQIRFIRVPDKATIRIFTPSGDLIKELRADQYSSPGGVTGDVPWDLKNGNGNPVVSGIYLYQVEMTDGRTMKGKFVIIK